MHMAELERSPSRSNTKVVLPLHSWPRVSCPRILAAPHPCPSTGPPVLTLVPPRWEFSLRLQAGAGALASVLRSGAASGGAEDQLLRGGAHLSRRSFLGAGLSQRQPGGHQGMYGAGVCDRG